MKLKPLNCVCVQNTLHLPAVSEEWYSLSTLLTAVSLISLDDNDKSNCLLIFRSCCCAVWSLEAERLELFETFALLILAVVLCTIAASLAAAGDVASIAVSVVEEIMLAITIIIAIVLRQI